MCIVGFVLLFIGFVFVVGCGVSGGMGGLLVGGIVCVLMVFVVLIVGLLL